MTAKPRDEASDRAAVVVEDDREPGTRGLVALITDPEIQRGVVRLPDLVRMVRLTPIE